MLEHGTQPVALVLADQRWLVSAAATAIDVNYHHLRNAVGGRCRPNDEVRERLPKLLCVPLEELFHPEALEKPMQVRARQQDELRAERGVLLPERFMSAYVNKLLADSRVTVGQMAELHRLTPASMVGILSRTRPHDQAVVGRVALALRAMEPHVPSGSGARRRNYVS